MLAILLRYFKTHNRVGIFLAINSLVLCNSLTYGQTNSTSTTSSRATLTGTITADQKEKAIGAYITFINTGFQTVTDSDGQYRLEEIPYGTYQVEVSFIGMENLVQEVTISQVVEELDFNLKASIEMLSEATVSAKSQSREQQEQAIQIESIELKRVIGQVKDITEAIERLPGINVRGSGSFGDRADITINGLNGTAVRTYLDGLPLEFVYPQFSINNIPVDNINRVDVYKGVVPINIGTDALGGGINIITQQKPYNEVKASYSYGSFNTHQASLGGSYVLSEGVTISAMGTYNYSDNNYSMSAFVWEEQEEQEIERFHDDYRLLYGGVGLDIRNKSWTDKFRISANYNSFHKAVQNGGAITNTSFGAVDYNGNATALSAIYEKKLTPNFSLEMANSYTYNNVIFTDTTANIYSWSGAIIARNTNQRGELGGNSLTDRNFENLVNRTNLHWDISGKDKILLSNLIAHQTTIGRDETKDIERDVLSKKQHLTKNIFGLQYERKLLVDRLTIGAAAKLYYYSLQGVEARSLAQVGNTGDQMGYYSTAKYDFTDRFFARVSYESALRIPTFFQFFGNGANILSNVELKPESSDNLNLGVGYRSTENKDIAFGTTINGFLRGQNDIIYLTADQFQQYKNAEEVRTVGIEGDFFISFRKNLRLQYNVTKLQQTYESISSDNPSAQFLVGTTFPNVPSFFMNARLSYRLTNLFKARNNLRFYTQYKYVDEFNFINVGQIYDSANYVPVQHRVDIGLNYTFWEDKISLAINANNIFDADIFDNFSIPRPGRNFNFKLTYRFNDF